MQTFLPDPDFKKTAKILDSRRLWKQCVECKQLLLFQYIDHPASKMWQGYFTALSEYAIVCANECINRNISALKILEEFEEHFIFFKRIQKLYYPPWLGDPNFHASHRSNLLRKSYYYYIKFGWLESSDLPYVWPI